jgi:hypothetical protein
VRLLGVYLKLTNELRRGFWQVLEQVAGEGFASGALGP